MNAGRVALFDVDGTLVRGLLIVDFPGYLARTGCFDPGKESEIRSLAQLHRRGAVSYRYISTRIPRLYAAGIEGQAQSRVRELGRTFIREAKGRLFPYTKGLVSLMARSGFLTVAISGSPIEVVSPLKPLGFAKIFGTEMEVRRGVYTGRVQRNLILSEEKKKVVGTIATKYPVDFENSFAFGDTEQDLPLLSEVGNPVSLNPNSALQVIATAKGWPIPRSVLREVKALLPGRRDHRERERGT